MELRSLIDDALEVTIVASFSRPGYILRRHLHRWPAPVARSMAGHTALITGPTSGLGRATTDALAHLGARIVLLGRSESRLAALRAELVARHGEDRFPIIVADMASSASVRGAIAQLTATEPRLDVLVDNAGAIHRVRTLTEDGLEATLATMVVNPLILIAGLLPLLRADGGRVISVTSGGMYAQRLDLDDLQGARGTFNGTLAYARAKRAQVILAREWSRRLGGTGIRFNAMHPGWADTPGLAESLPGFHAFMRPVLRTPAEGVDTIVWLATDPEAGTRGGQLFLDRRARPIDRLPSTRMDADQRRRLWDLVVGLSGLPDPAPEAVAPPGALRPGRPGC